MPSARGPHLAQWGHTDDVEISGMISTWSPTTSYSGEASKENDLGRFYFKIFARSERRAEAYYPTAGARDSGARDPQAQLAGTEAGL